MPPFAPSTSMRTPTPFSLPAHLTFNHGHRTCQHCSTVLCLGTHSIPTTSAHFSATSITIRHGGNPGNTLAANRIPAPIQHPVRITAHPQSSITTSPAMPKGFNQSRSASITQTADRYSFPTVANHAPTPTVVKCPTMTPSSGITPPTARAKNALTRPENHSPPTPKSLPIPPLITLCCPTSNRPFTA